MDGERIELATILVHLASAFGFVTNSIAVATIAKCVNMHTTFGILCACLAANNCTLVVLNSVWYMLPDAGVFKTGSMASRATGWIGTVLWITGIRFHLLISINRLIAIAFPLRRGILENTRITLIIVLVVIVETLLQCSPLILVDDIWFVFDRTTLQWIHTESLFWTCMVDLSNMVEIFSVFIIDAITLIALRLSHPKSESAPNTSSFNSRAVEIRLYKQALSQSVPLLTVLVCFVVVTPRLSEQLAKFLTTTFVWHLAHGFDGLIIDLFHTRRDLFFKKKKDSNRTIAVSSVAPSNWG